jgi:LPS-assembly protein
MAGKRALLGGAALAILWAGTAAAKPPAAPLSPAPPPVPVTKPGADGLKPDELYMEADEVIREDKIGRTTAVGNIEVRYENRTLRADKIVYDDKSGVIHAYGHVITVNADGTFEFADELIVDDKMAAGIALGFSARLQENVKIAAATSSKRNENVEELTKAIYTPCDICTKDGSPKTPTWSIAADRVVRNKAKRIVYYRNARFRLFGITVGYLPVFWHADPESKRNSGLLVPKASISDRRGFSYEQPYYWAISPSMDLILSPQFNTHVNPFLNGEFRKRFYSGDIDVRFGYTHERDFDGQGNRFGKDTSRSYILGRGGFQINDKWRWGFTAERASDDLIFDKYEVGKVYESRGPYIADDHRLISQVYTVRQDDRSYASVAAMTIQGLRPGDVDRTFPTIAPLVEGHYEAPETLFGGRLRFHTSAVALEREQSPSNLSVRLPGMDSARVTGEVDWRRAFTSPSGIRVEPFVNLRADAYKVNDILTGVGSQTRSETLNRGLATGGVDVSYPFFKRTSDATIILEPVAQVAASPNAKQVVIGTDPTTGQPVYLNEDSVAFEFDETTLFRTDKFPGYDLYEDGVRLNVAGRATVLWDDGRRANLLIGRSFRTQRNLVFSPSSGLRTKASDWIVAADAQPIRGWSMFARARLDSDTLSVQRLEAGVNTANKYGSGYIRYFRDDLDVNGNKQENMDVGGEVYFGPHYGVSVYGNRDLRRNAWVRRDLGVFYRDDCFRVDVVYRREDTILGRLLPSNSVQLRLTLATLGASSSGR